MISARSRDSSRKLRLIERTTAANDLAPWLRPHYRSLIATTSQSASAPRNGTQSLPDSAGRESPSCRPAGQRYQGAPSHVPRESSRPGSRRLYAGHRLASKRAPARLIPEQQVRPGFDVSRVCYDTSSAIHLRSSSWSPPDAFHGTFSHIAHYDSLRLTQQWAV